MDLLSRSWFHMCLPPVKDNHYLFMPAKYSCIQCHNNEVVHADGRAQEEVLCLVSAQKDTVFLVSWWPVNSTLVHYSKRNLWGSMRNRENKRSLPVYASRALLHTESLNEVVHADNWAHEETKFTDSQEGCDKESSMASRDSQSTPCGFPMRIPDFPWVSPDSPICGYPDFPMGSLTPPRMIPYTSIYEQRKHNHTCLCQHSTPAYRVMTMR
jgi:hypothetical protein